jgi:hypothetical protein
VADYQLESSKFYKEVEFTSNGILEPSNGTNIYGVNSIVVEVENVKGDNEVLLEGRLKGSANWIIIKSFRGPVLYDNLARQAVDISKYNLIRFSVDKYSPADNTGKNPKLIASGFYSTTADTASLSLLEQQAQLIIEMNCNIAEILRTIKTIEKHVSVVTGIEFNGDK